MKKSPKLKFQPFKEIPKTLSPAKKRFLRVYAAFPGFLLDAARKSGVPPRTVYNWLRDDLTFRETYDTAGEHMDGLVMAKLIEHIKKDNLKAIIYYLNTFAKHRGYGQRPTKACRFVP